MEKRKTMKKRTNDYLLESLPGAAWSEEELRDSGVYLVSPGSAIAKKLQDAGLANDLTTSRGLVACCPGCCTRQDCWSERHCSAHPTESSSA
jgi:hypothetical protein